MNRRNAPARGMRTASAFATLAAAFAFAGSVSAEPAKGTVAQGGRSATIRHAWLVAGPDAIDPKTTVRQVVLSATDIGARIGACARMGCVSGLVEEGMTVIFGAGPRLLFWVSLNGQRVQYSGTEAPSSFVATANEGKRIAGRLVIDKTTSGGSKIDVQFDAPLVKTFTAN